MFGIELDFGLLQPLSFLISIKHLSASRMNIVDLSHLYEHNYTNDTRKRNLSIILDIQARIQKQLSMLGKTTDNVIRDWARPAYFLIICSPRRLGTI